MSPWIHLRCRLRSDHGGRFLLGSDPIDDGILEDLLGPLSDFYIPSELTAKRAPFILEVGGHHGHVAVEMLVRAPQARLLVVEPDPSAVRTIHKHLQLNGLASRCEVVAGALGDSDGATILRRSREGSWGNSTVPGANESCYFAGGISVAQRSLDSILRGRRPDIVLCNAEGAETFLIPQLETLELRPDVLILMLHPRHVDDQELLGRLKRSMFELQAVGPIPNFYHCRPVQE